MSTAVSTPANANARRQAAFVARKTKEGRKRKLYWLTAEEEKVIRATLQKLRAEREQGVSDNTAANGATTANNSP